MDASSLFAGFIFGTIGIYVLGAAKRRANYPLALSGLGLIVFSLFTPSGWITWTTGFVLCALAYYYR